MCNDFLFFSSSLYCLNFTRVYMQYDVCVCVCQTLFLFFSRLCTPFRLWLLRITKIIRKIIWKQIYTHTVLPLSLTTSMSLSMSFEKYTQFGGVAIRNIHDTTEFRLKINTIKMYYLNTHNTHAKQWQIAADQNENSLTSILCTPRQQRNQPKCFQRKNYWTNLQTIKMY